MCILPYDRWFAGETGEEIVIPNKEELKEHLAKFAEEINKTIDEKGINIVFNGNNIKI